MNTELLALTVSIGSVALIFLGIQIKSIIGRIK